MGEEGNWSGFGRDKLDDKSCAQKMLLKCIKGGTSIFEEVSKKNQPKSIKVSEKKFKKGGYSTRTLKTHHVVQAYIKLNMQQ